MDLSPQTSASDELGSLPALQDIATNGKLLSEALSQVIQALESWRTLVLKASHGGTGLSSYVVGDLIYAATTETLARLADVAVGKVLVSGGVGAPPAWGDVPGGSISGVIPVANGGTGRATLTDENLLIGDGTSDVEFLAPGSAGNFVASDGSAFSSSSGATAAQYRANTAGATAIRPAEIWTSAGFAALTDAATIAVDLSTGFNFFVVIAGSRTLGNPTNVKPGQSGVIGLQASGGPYTINVDTNWYANAAAGFPISIASGTNCFIGYFCVNSTYILVTGVVNNPT